ncbi:sensor histidine kinase [Sediminicoccus sp. BL-A-41-H5]|uniref:sensor histidine kinase n=1 Tax=Sediminicoccus sp. BL-A-41-H5 TaxID=3421106 RepID=UPI003D6747AE
MARRLDGTCEIVGYILDVSAEREAQARAMSAARLASLGEMAAGLAHEMKQPLQSISLAAEMGQIAATEGDIVGVDEQFEQIVEQTQRTAQTIEHLRRFARGAEEGGSSQAVPLTTLVEGVLDLTRSVLHDASIKVEVDLGDPSPVVQGQEVLLERVLSNLLLNARDALAARPDGAPRRICIAAAPGSDGTVRLTVADTGGGIAPDVMAQLFEPFVTTKGPETGTGLGLSICHRLVKGMGGSIEAHNDAEGAVFTIKLPGSAQGETNDKLMPHA